MCISFLKIYSNYKYLLFFIVFFLNIKLYKELINQYMHLYDYLMILNALMNLNEIN